MIREDRELLAELARLNRAMAPFAMRVMEGTASVAEQQDYARHLITAGEWLQRRAQAMQGAVIDGEVLPNASLALPVRIVESSQES